MSVSSADPLISIQIDHLTVRFGAFTAVNDLSFSVKTGEIFGLLGANGAGKTTAIRVMCGLLEPTLGSVSIGNTLLQRGVSSSAIEEIKSKIGYMSQKFTLYDDLTIYENWSFISSLRNISRAQLKRRMEELFIWLPLAELKNSLVKDLPSGLKQQVALTAALFHDPDVIFLDEPTAGVSPFARQQFWKLIADLAKQGKTLIVTTHYMDEAEYCDRLSLMRSGELIALGSPNELKKQAFPDKPNVTLDDVFLHLVEGINR